MCRKFNQSDAHGPAPRILLMPCSISTVNAFTNLPAKLGRLRRVGVSCTAGMAGDSGHCHRHEWPKRNGAGGALERHMRAWMPASRSLSDSPTLSIGHRCYDGRAVEQFINADTLMSPGSIMKVLTTYAALEILGPNLHLGHDFSLNGDMSDSTALMAIFMCASAVIQN